MSHCVCPAHLVTQTVHLSKVPFRGNGGEGGKGEERKEEGESNRKDCGDRVNWQPEDSGLELDLLPGLTSSPCVWHMYLRVMDVCLTVDTSEAADRLYVQQSVTVKQLHIQLGTDLTTMLHNNNFYLKYLKQTLTD